MRGRYASAGRPVARGGPTGAGRAWRGAFLLLLLGMLALPAAAQQEDRGSSLLTPFPENDTYRMVVIGDAFAEGILAGLQDAFGPETRVEVPRRQRELLGIARNDFEDEIRWLEDPAQSRETFHLAVVMVGVGDRRAIRAASGRQMSVGTGDWLELYGQRVDRLVKALKRRQIAVYWVGLPIVKRSDWSDDYTRMNDVIREKTFLNGQRYIDIFQGFADDGGGFDSWGPDLTGKMRKMRDGDGVLFTADGNRKLAHYVEREIKRDLVQARNDRAVPLLGSEDEQKRIAPRHAATGAGGPAGAAPSGAAAAAQPLAQQTVKPADQSAEQAADTTRLALRVVSIQGREETVTMELPRPAIAANVVALVTRRQSPDKPAQLGDSLTSEIADGVLVLSTVTPVSTGGRRALSVSQSPYFRLLVKGERLNPKVGRVDDFTWPRAADVEPVPTTPAPPVQIKRGPGRQPPRS